MHCQVKKLVWNEYLWRKYKADAPFYFSKNTCSASPFIVRSYFAIKTKEKMKNTPTHHQ
jgi:hypothetical protein